MTFATPLIAGLIAAVAFAELVVICMLLSRLRRNIQAVTTRDSAAWDGKSPPPMHRVHWEDTDFAPMDRDLELTLVGLLYTVCVWGRGNSAGDQAAAMDFAAMCDELHNVPAWLASRDASKEDQFLRHFERMDRPWAAMLRDRKYPTEWRKNDAAFHAARLGSDGDA